MMQRDGRRGGDIEAVEALRHVDPQRLQASEQGCRQAFTFGTEVERQSLHSPRIAKVGPAARRQGESG